MTAMLVAAFAAIRRIRPVVPGRAADAFRLRLLRDGRCLASRPHREAFPMALPVALLHRTSYRYDRPVMLGPQIVRLRPTPHTRSPVLSYALTVTPDPGSLHWYQ